MKLLSLLLLFIPIYSHAESIIQNGIGGGPVTVSSFTISNMTSGSVIFSTTSGQLSQNNANFFWDNVNNRLGVGTNSPQYLLHGTGSGYIAGQEIVGGTMTVQGNVFSVGGSSFTVNSSTINAAGPYFSVGGGTLIVNGGLVGVNMNPAYAMDVTGSIRYSTNLRAKGSIVNDTNPSNATILPGTNGSIISRNQSDAMVALTVNQLNSGSTGDFVDFVLNGSSKAWFTSGGSEILSSTLTVQGNAFSVGGSTLVANGGNVGIGITAPQALLDIGGSTGIFSRTIAQLVAITPTAVGQTYFCNNCSPAKLVVSTGTSAANFADATGGNFK